ncbi:hypothetical protein KNV64_gp07 [Staphylococcus phage vB_SauP_EBHT]|uniref:Uncharacterized protein n=1 Tax=Staphylococcus phage Portland TaxID=2650876 RepID=A0A7L8ZJM4_9CAUD|nr:hypothetical protein KNV64_gp07 [Staphylococcus phage vB_SauP_EBHT]QOI69183.1 hypothetical protein EBHT_00007 [Staphylococcus phage Portland]
MVRHTSAMDRWKKEREARKEREEKKYKNDFSGINFKFDDKDLQEAYIDAWKHFSHLPHLPKDKNVSYVNAISLVRGKQHKKLNHILEIYNRNDNNNKNAKMHKYALYNLHAEKNKSSLTKYIKEIDNLFFEIGKSDRPKTTIDDINVRYNFLYYATFDE